MLRAPYSRNSNSRINWSFEQEIAHPNTHSPFFFAPTNINSYFTRRRLYLSHLRAHVLQAWVRWRNYRTRRLFSEAWVNSRVRNLMNVVVNALSCKYSNPYSFQQKFVFGMACWGTFLHKFAEIAFSEPTYDYERAQNFIIESRQTITMWSSIRHKASFFNSGNSG